MDKLTVATAGTVAYLATASSGMLASVDFEPILQLVGILVGAVLAWLNGRRKK